MNCGTDTKSVPIAERQFRAKLPSPLPSPGLTRSHWLPPKNEPLSTPCPTSSVTRYPLGVMCLRTLSRAQTHHSSRGRGLGEPRQGFPQGEKPAILPNSKKSTPPKVGGSRGFEMKFTRGIFHAIAFSVPFWAVIIAAFILAACAPMHFTCGSGEFGPRADLRTADPSIEVIENLSRLCSQEVE